jgi:hypothetical protein
LSIKVKIKIVVFTLRWCRIRYGDISYMGAYIALFLCTSWYSPLGSGMCVLLSWLTVKMSYVFYPEKVRGIELCFICMVLYRRKKMPSLGITPRKIILNPRSCICRSISHIHPDFRSGFFPSLANYSFVRMLISITYIPWTGQWNV